MGVGYVTEWYQSLSSTLDPYGPRTSVNLGKFIVANFLSMSEFGGKIFIHWEVGEN
jgi:hypothetical protein